MPTCRNACSYLLAAAVCLGIVASAAADTLVLFGGRRIQGRLIRQGDHKVEFEVHSSSGKVIGVQTYPRNKIYRIIKDSDLPAPQPADPNNPSYAIVPIEGTIGMDVTAGVLERMLKLARNTGTAVVILEIDSPGGVVQDLLNMLKVLQRYGDLRIIAYVRRAHSSAAILAMACREIVMAPSASIGGAVVFKFTPAGTPANINAKFESIIRSECKAAAEGAGHNSLLVDGMMDAQIVLKVIEKNSRRVVVTGQANETEGVLKKKGQILTLTAKQAVDVKLANGLATNFKGIPAVVGIQQWHPGLADARTVLTDWRRKNLATRGQLKNAAKRADGFLAKAAAHHPARFRYRTRQELHDRVDECVRNLRLADTHYAMAERIIHTNPDLGFSADGLSQIRRRIAGWIAEIEAFKKR